jgi:dienelactone hydrolase
MSCPECFQGHQHEGTPRGTTTKLHGLDTYVAEPADGRPVRGIIVIIPDAFGWEFVNNRILADHYADKGDYRVYLPDFMHGEQLSTLVYRVDSTSLPTHSALDHAC